MFFEQFALEESELQKWLSAANSKTPQDEPLGSLTADDRRVLMHEELPGMLSTNEPPATRFVIQRVQLIVDAATQLSVASPGADSTAEDFAHACLSILLVGCAPVCRAVVLGSLPELCHRLGVGSTPQHLHHAGQAGGAYDSAADSSAFESRCVADRLASPRPSHVFLAMHAAQVLSVAIRATAAVDSVMVSDSLRGIQLSTSGNKSVGAAVIKDALREHASSLGCAVANALGIVKQADRLANDLIVHVPSCAAEFSEALSSSAMIPLAAGSSFEDAARHNARIKSLLVLLDSIGANCAPGTREGESFAAMWDRLLDSDDFMGYVLGRCFSTIDDDVAITTSLRQAITSAMESVLVKSKKWNERWRGRSCERVASMIARTSTCPTFIASLRGERTRRADQLACVRLLDLGAGTARKALLGPRLPDVDGTPATEFGTIRSMLPSSDALQSLLLACEASPVCDVLHCSTSALLDTVASLSSSAGLAPSESRGKFPLTEATCAAVAASVILDDCGIHRFAALHANDSLRSLSVLLTAMCRSLVLDFGEEGSDLDAFKALCASIAKDAVRSAINPESERNLSEGETLRRFCVAATEQQLDVDLTHSGNSVSAGGRVKVDEVDDLPVPNSPNGSSLAFARSPTVGPGDKQISPMSQRRPEATAAESVAIRVIGPLTDEHASPPADPVAQTSGSTATYTTGGNFSPPSGGESLSFDRNTESTAGSDLSPQSSMHSQGSRRFGVVRRRTTASPGSQPAASPTLGAPEAAGMLPQPELDAGRLSLTSSLNESCHSGFDRGSSYEVEENGGRPLQPPGRVRRQRADEANASETHTAAPLMAPAQPDLFAAWGTQ